MQESKEKKILRTKKKRWYNIFAPKLLKGILIGETFLSDPKLILGKTIKVNLMTLTNDVKKQNINVKFILNQVQGEKALTQLIGYEVIPSSIKRLVRKGEKRVDSSFVCETSDKKKVRIKPLFLIKTTTKSSIESALRKQTLNFLTKTIKKLDYDTLTNNLIFHKLQSSLRDELKIIYPLKICEIRQMILEREKKVEESKEKGIKEIKENIEIEEEKKSELKKAKEEVNIEG